MISLSLAFIICLTFVFHNAQLNNSSQSIFYFPSELPGQVSLASKNIHSNIETSLAPTYDAFINQLITTGMSNLTLTINRILLETGQAGGNVLFSPVSITCALSLILLGANGKTFSEISNVLGLSIGIPDIYSNSQTFHEKFATVLSHFAQTAGTGQHVAVATAIFLQTGYPIRPLYKSTVEELYKGQVINVDFEHNSNAAQATVNEWVAQKTNDKIKSLLNKPPTSDTKIILASALYFKAEWKNQFYEGVTRREKFFINGHQSPATFEVDIMGGGGDYPYYKDIELGCEILGYPYKHDRTTMYVVMPFNSSKAVLQQFVSKLTVQDLQRLVNSTVVRTAVTLFPRMRLESSIDLVKTLSIMGVKSLFDPLESNLALLSNGLISKGKQLFSKSILLNQTLNTIISPLPSQSKKTLDNLRRDINSESANNRHQNPGLYATDVVHKVYMEITEKGTEAAAATGVALSKSGGKLSFRVNVPFFFFIRHEETKTILFWGSVTEPNPNYPIVNNS